MASPLASRVGALAGGRVAGADASGAFASAGGMPPLVSCLHAGREGGGGVDGGDGITQPSSGVNFKTNDGYPTAPSKSHRFDSITVPLPLSGDGAQVDVQAVWAGTVDVRVRIGAAGRGLG